MGNSLWLLSLATSWALFGLIWVIQLNHYPSFSYIDESEFLNFHHHHTSSITLIVMPLMLLELGLSLYLAYEYRGFWIASAAMVLLIWASTFFIQVPLHNQLDSGKDIAIIQQLVTTNWIRTALWTLKALLLSWLFLRAA